MRLPTQSSRAASPAEAWPDGPRRMRPRRARGRIARRLRRRAIRWPRRRLATVKTQPGRATLGRLRTRPGARLIGDCGCASPSSHVSVAVVRTTVVVGVVVPAVVLGYTAHAMGAGPGVVLDAVVVCGMSRRARLRDCGC